MHWGHGITLFFTAFLIFMLTMVYKTFQVDFDLVADDYYAKELVHQKQIDQQENALQLEEKPSWKISDGQFQLDFPNSLTEGKINFFRPSDDLLDFEEKISLKDKQQFIPLSKFKKGIYTVQLSWADQGKDYYIEEKIRIP